MFGGDFNFTPELLRKSGWLQLVRGTIHQPASPTCNGKIYDYFVSSQGMNEAVVGVAVVEGTGIRPHRPTRIFLKAKMKALRIRVVKNPSKFPAVLPAGCLPDEEKLDSDMREKVTRLASGGELAAAMACWFNRVEDQVIQVMGLEGRTAY